LMPELLKTIPVARNGEVARIDGERPAR